MSARPFISAWTRLPLVGHEYEIDTFGGDRIVGKIVDARYVPGRVEVVFENGDRLSTALNLRWRPAPAVSAVPCHTERRAG